MRLSITSGVLAAQSLLSGDDYDRLWQRELKPQMETSVVNRALYSLVGNGGYGWFLRWITSHANPRRALGRHYRASWFKGLLQPWARHRYESRRRDVSCNHIDCHCVWCRGEGCVHE
jgi:hypothetical protein